MKNFIFLLAYSIFFLLLQYSSPIYGEPINLIDSTCKKTPYNDLCTSTLRSYPNSSDTDVEGLAAIIVESVVVNATCTLGFIHELTKETIDPTMERPLNYCAELYIPVVKYTLPQGAEAFDKGQYEFAEYCLYKAGKEADTCEKMFSGAAVSPLTDRTKIFRELCDVAIAIIKTLHKS